MKYLSIVTTVMAFFWNTLQAQIVTQDSVWFNEDYTETTLRMEFGQALSQDSIHSTGLPFHFVFASPYDSIAVASVQGNESFTTYDITFTTRPNTYYSLLTLDIKTQDGDWHSYSTNFFAGEDKSGLDTIRINHDEAYLIIKSLSNTSSIDNNLIGYNPVLTLTVLNSNYIDELNEQMKGELLFDLESNLLKKSVISSTSIHLKAVTDYSDYGSIIGNYSQLVQSGNDSALVYSFFSGRPFFDHIFSRDTLYAPLLRVFFREPDKSGGGFMYLGDATITDFIKPFKEWDNYWFYTDLLGLSIEDEIDPHFTHDFQITSTYPNPFNPSTQIQVSLSQAVEFRLVVYDLLGRRVQSWQSPQRFASGSHQITLDFSGLASGTYVIELLGMNLANGQVSRQTTMVSLVK